MPNRGAGGVSYRYGFNGQEAGHEIKGIGNSYTAEFWEYDPRIGRRWNVDPVVKEFESPYAGFGCNPAYYVDPLGFDWRIETSGRGGHKQTVLKSDAGDYIKGFEDWYKKGGLNLSKKQYARLFQGVSEALEGSRREVIAGKGVPIGYTQLGISYNLSENVLNIRVHVGLEHRNGFGGSKDGHVGLEFQSQTFHYFGQEE